MNNPCDDCVVDAMCSKTCRKFVDFMKDFSLHPSWFTTQLCNVISTQSRFKRAKRFAAFYNKEMLSIKLTMYYKLQIFKKQKRYKK